MTVFKRIGITLMGLLLLAYIGYHALVIPYTSIKTESAVSYSAKKSISVTESYIIRNEHLVTSEQAGVCSYAVANGSKVANGGTIASVYASQTAAETQMKLADLDRQIEALTALQGMGSNIVVSIDQLDKKLQTALISALSGAADGDYSTLKADSESYLTLLNRRLAVTDPSVDFSALIASLQSQRNTLAASADTALGTVSAPCSGYFVSTVDGYESVLSSENIETLTPEAFDAVKPDATVNDDAFVGKVVSDMQWYIAAEVSFDDSLLLSEGMTITVDIPASAVGELPVTVARVNKGESGEKAVVIFRCSYMSAELSSLRSPAFQIVLKRYEGLRVSKEAIRVEDGKKGVYVSIGSSVKFTPVEVLYDGNGYVICKKVDPLESGLHLYDDVVVKGKNLYDGKPI